MSDSIKIIKFQDVSVNLDLVHSSWGNHNPTIKNNLENIITDFNYMHSEVTLSLASNLSVEEENYIMESFKNEKTNMLNAFIAGVLSAISPSSSFNVHHVISKEQKSAEFAKSILL